MRPDTDKHFRCTICQRGFTRIDHLKRHHLRHSGIKPYSCVFCNDSFARWYVLCCNLYFIRQSSRSLCRLSQARRSKNTRDRTAREEAACLSIVLVRNGGSSATMIAKHKSSTRERMQREDHEQSSDRGSIKFLLNGGTDSFTQQFLLPPRSDRTRSLEYHNKKNLEEAESSILGYELKGGRADYAPTFIESDAATLTFFQDTFIDFFNGPFGDPHKLLDNPFAGEVAYHAVIPPGQDANLTFATPQLSHEPERPFATAMIQAILTRAWSVPLDAKAQGELSTNLHFLLTTARIRKFVSIYFKYWQPSCAFLHRASFDPEVVSLPLLTAVAFMGAMYSTDEREAYVAKRVLDFAELFIFSSDVYASETEISAAFSGNRCLEDEPNDWMHFQKLQSGFLVVVVQYWAGSRVSRHRVMEHRFSEVIKVARRIGLVKCRHLPHDPMDEFSWIQKECRIRTMNIISLLDCAFSFYSNYPCRLSHTEMACDFPCQESVFDSHHPFVEPSFQFARDIPISEAFEYLFDNSASEDPSQSHIDSLSTMTIFDMFMLIHLLYAFINTHMTLLAPLVRKTQIPRSKRSSSTATSKSSHSAIPEDSTLAAIRTALSRWRDHWVTLRNTVSSHEWASMGFYKNGYNFWLVSQLLITKKKSVDVVMQMEVKCEDKLEKLKVLLLDESD
ncbi:FTFMHR domain-containing protein, partial [Aspergillus clavatus NRRL 1]